MRYVLVALGVVTLALGVILAVEGLWWAAIPDGLFGFGVAWVAYVSLRDEHRQAAAPAPQALPARPAEPPRRRAS